MMRLALVTVIVSLVSLASAEMAAAGLVRSDSRGLTFAAGRGERNDVRVQRSGARIAFTDRGAPIRLAGGGGCKRHSRWAVACRLRGRRLRVRLRDRDDAGFALVGVLDGGPGDDRLRGEVVRGGDGSDVIRPVGDFSGTLDGGRGDDVIVGDREDNQIYGGPGDDQLNGGPGYDLLRGQGGDDRLYGGPGDDTLEAGEGRDLLSGGPGRRDIAEYVVGKSDPPIEVSLDGRRNDGTGRVRHAVGPDVEGVTVEAHAAGSRVVGNQGANRFHVRGDQPVTVFARGGDDQLFDHHEGDPATLYGEGGDDHFDLVGPSRAFGGAGNDGMSKGIRNYLNPGSSVQFIGGPGADRIHATDYSEAEGESEALDPIADSIECGTGADEATGDQLDTFAPDCERTGRVPRGRCECAAADHEIGHPWSTAPIGFRSRLSAAGRR